ncbi:hypothetical protein C8J56DRAFT_903100 [Mycena floridula]|nr:hypothetical protein C8J56DRAFT_903100 [Mycena floridula]
MASFVLVAFLARSLCSLCSLCSPHSREWTGYSNNDACRNREGGVCMLGRSLVWDRVDELSGRGEKLEGLEVIPEEAKEVGGGEDPGVCTVGDKVRLKSLSIKQGLVYDSPESVAEIPAFIAFHGLDVGEVDSELPLADRSSFGRPSVLPFESVSEATKIWIKGREFGGAGVASAGTASGPSSGSGLGSASGSGSGSKACATGLSSVPFTGQGSGGEDEEGGGGISSDSSTTYMDPSSLGLSMTNEFSGSGNTGTRSRIHEQIDHPADVTGNGAELPSEKATIALEPVQSEDPETERQRRLQAQAVEMERQLADVEAALNNMTKVSPELGRALITENIQLKAEIQVLHNLKRSEYCVMQN